MSNLGVSKTGVVTIGFGFCFGVLAAVVGSAMMV
jgi:hypothetical protein